jgi:ATP-dependent Clp protease protease subunit
VGLHQPSGGGQGKLPDLALQAQGIVRPRTEMEQVLARHTGQRVEKLREDAERGLVLSAEEAVAYGLADAVLGSRKPSTLLA